MTVKQIASKTLVHSKLLILLLGLVLTGSLAASGFNHLMSNIQISQVQLRGDLKYLNADTLTHDLTIRFMGDYLETILAEVIYDVEKHPWVASASARRVWPDTLLIEITEQRPVAIYNDTQYLGLSGDLFEPPLYLNQPLPRLYGALSETMQIYSHYGIFSKQLSDFSEVLAVSRGHDLGWEIKLANGISLQLGRSDILGRLARAHDVLNRLSKNNLFRVETIDARYDNGVALAWRSQQ